MGSKLRRAILRCYSLSAVSLLKDSGVLVYVFMWSDRNIVVLSLLCINLDIKALQVPCIATKDTLIILNRLRVVSAWCHCLLPATTGSCISFIARYGMMSLRTFMIKVDQTLLIRPNSLVRYLISSRENTNIELPSSPLAGSATIRSLHFLVKLVGDQHVVHFYYYRVVH